MSSPTKIAVVSLRLPEAPDTIEARWEQIERHVREAGRAGCALLVLPEHAFTHETAELARGAPRSDFAEPVPGPACERLGALARETGMALIAGLCERDGERLYNTIVVVAADGTLAGHYRKTHPTPFEVRTAGITPGDALPVFDLGFGPFGILNCMDLYFPEAARALAVDGARLLLWPTMAFGPTAEQLLVLCRARALENGAWLAAANYAADPPYAPYAGRSAMGRACIIDPDGVVLADTGHRPSLVAATVDLDEPRRTAGVVGAREDGWDLLPGDFLALRRPQAYGAICRPLGKTAGQAGHGQGGRA